MCVTCVAGVVSTVAQLFLYALFRLFLPPAFVSSTALYHYGPDALVKQQFLYSEPYQFFVPMHYVFFWRYFAGAAFVVFLIVGVAVMVINLLVDLSYGLLDPKVRYR